MQLILEHQLMLSKSLKNPKFHTNVVLFKKKDKNTSFRKFFHLELQKKRPCNEALSILK